MTPEKVNLAQKLSLFDEHWTPKVVGELNGQHVKLVKLLGSFVWHHHDEEDELFLVVKGRFRIDYRDRSEWIEEGKLLRKVYLFRGHPTASDPPKTSPGTPKRSCSWALLRSSRPTSTRFPILNRSPPVVPTQS